MQYGTREKPGGSSGRLGEKPMSGVGLLKYLVFFALAGLAQGWSSGHARDFRAADTQSEDYPTVQALMVMDRIVNEKTKGRHRIRVFHSRQLGEEKETIEQTKVGAIDLNRTNVAPLGSFVPEANVLVLPFLFRSMEHLYGVLDGPVGADVLASFETYGFVGLAFYDSGARSIYNNVRPVKSLADLKGMRVRVQQSDLMIDMMQALGAVPVALPYGQVLTGLTTRLIDGAENNWPSYVTTNHYTAARFYTLTEHTMSPEVLVMSRKAWDSLSAEDRKIFRDAAREFEYFHAPAMEGVGGTLARAGGKGRQRDHRRSRPQAVHGRNVGNLP